MFFRLKPQTSDRSDVSPPQHMLQICSLSGEEVAIFHRLEGQSVKALKRLVAQQIGIPRFRQRWLVGSCELDDETVLKGGEVQSVLLVKLDFVECQEEQIKEFISASREGNVNEVEKFLKLPLNPDVPDPRSEGRRLQRGHYEQMFHRFHRKSKRIMEKMMEVNSHKLRAMHLAAEEGHSEIVQLLLEAGADNDLRSEAGASALQLAALKGHLEVARLLIQKGTGLELLCFAEEGRLEAVQLLLEGRADPDKVRHDGLSALQMAAVHGHSEVAQSLLEGRADPNKVRHDGLSALHLPAKNGYSEVVRLLLEGRADPDKVTNDGVSASQLAATQGHSEVVRLLLEAGASTDHTTEVAGVRALHLAAENGD